MNQIELLAPAGDEECLRSALDYGCDAVYLAGKSFGMRAGAKNFDMDGLDRAVRLAHERGVSLYRFVEVGFIDDFLRRVHREYRDAAVDHFHAV